MYFNLTDLYIAEKCLRYKQCIDICTDDAQDMGRDGLPVHDKTIAPAWCCEKSSRQTEKHAKASKFHKIKMTEFKNF